MLVYVAVCERFFGSRPRTLRPPIPGGTTASARYERVHFVISRIVKAGRVSDDYALTDTHVARLRGHLYRQWWRNVDWWLHLPGTRLGISVTVAVTAAVIFGVLIVT